MSDATLSRAIKQKARTYALQLLYARDVAHDAGAAAVESDVAPAWAEGFEVDVPPEGVAYAQALCQAVDDRRAEIDASIVQHSRNWRLERMSRIDRNILRLGTAELLAFADTPHGVVINEAIELGKRFGTGESGAFINGILDRIAKGVAGTAVT
ncbi:MAG: transcription antitermination factor NusB [Myxococcales bacterium]|nr:transcription antitermination factor NusB [Myxococcales bacterium]